MFNIESRKKLKKTLENICNNKNSNEFLSYTQKIKSLDIQSLISNKFYQNKHQFFWENNKSNLSFIGFGCIDKIELYNSSDLAVIKSKIDKKLNVINDISNNPKHISPKFFGGYAFDINSEPDDNWNKFPKGYFILPECMITYNKENTWVTIISKINKSSNSEIVYRAFEKIYNELIKYNLSKKISTNKMTITHNKNNPDKNNYIRIINELIHKIKLTDLEKIVFSRSKYLQFDNTLNFAEIIRILRNTYPQCINFFIKIPSRGIFFGSTPERLIRKNNTIINTEAIAGTAPRGDDDENDYKIAHELINDAKNNQEHQLVVEQIKKILDSRLINIKISEKPYILKLENVQHLISDITGELKEKNHILELVRILHPTPAVAGVPLDKALKLILKYENHNRGWYSGPLGWIDKFGDGDFCVALRSGVVSDNSIQIFSGGGIMSGSIPEHEWEETELKFKALLSIIGESSYA